MKIAFYVLGEKGLKALTSLTDAAVSMTAGVVIGTDKSVRKDYADEIEVWCKDSNVSFSYDDTVSLEFNYIFAIGWRKMISVGDDQKLVVLHDSILPRYRGFNPLVTALINGDEEVGVTAIYGAETYDTGPIIDVEIMTVTYPIKIASAISQIGDCYGALVNRILEKIAAGTITASSQDESKATYSLWRDARDYYIDWNESAERIVRHIDAVGFPYQGAKCRVAEKEYTVVEASVFPDVNVENRGAGKVIFKDAGKPVIACGKGLIRLEEVRDDSGALETFANSFRLRFE